MEETKTHSERRSAGLHLELIPINEALKKDMEESRKAAAIDTTPYESGEGELPDNFRPYDQGQDFFVNVSKKAFLDAEHPAAVIDRVVERLDLKGVYAAYSKEGNPPYHPKMMLKVLFYAYYCGIMSCRTIWEQVVHRADFIYLSAGQVPNFRTINSFRLRHLERLPGLFTQIVYLCGTLGLIGFEHLAIDGQKIEANASFRRSKNLKQVKKEYARVKQGLEKLLTKEISEAFPEVKKLQELDDEDARLNMTDRDAKVMRHKDGTSTPSYTHQSAVDDAYGVVTAVQTTCGNGGPEDLLPMVDESKKNSGKRHKSVTADCEACEQKERCTEGKKRHLYINVHEPWRKKMRGKLSSDKGREIYMKRQGTVEPVHGDDQKNKGWIQHHLRGLKKAQGEFLLIRIATNLGKIVKFRTGEMLAMGTG